MGLDTLGWTVFKSNEQCKVPLLDKYFLVLVILEKLLQ